MVITCGGCPATWTAQGAAHCAAAKCHRTFGSVTAFDKHRKSGTCQHPLVVGMQWSARRRCWTAKPLDATTRGWFYGQE